jgi:Ca2+-binding EF-hand superfamily protein
MVKIIDPSLTPQEISWIFLAFDVNRDGQITCSEFIEIIENQQYEQSSSLIKINLFEPIECNVPVRSS